MSEERIEKLEAEVKRLNIKLETLVNYFNISGRFGPPDGRDLYDKWVRDELKKAGL